MPPSNAHTSPAGYHLSPAKDSFFSVSFKPINSFSCVLPPGLQQQMASSRRRWLRQSSSMGNEDRLTHPPSLICNSWMQAVDRAQAFALKHPAWIAKHHCILTHWGWLNVLPSASVWDTHSIMLGYCKSLTCCAVDRSGFAGRKFPF
jgi:hypothetical protein